MSQPISSPPVGTAPLSANARTVLEKRYLVKDATGMPIERPEEMFWRVATTVAEADRRYGASDSGIQAVSEEFYRLMTESRFEPNSPTLMNAGRPLGQLSACFVLPVADALSNGKDGIYDTLKSMAIIHQSGGGTGFSFSRLRPAGSMVQDVPASSLNPESWRWTRRSKLAAFRPISLVAAREVSVACGAAEKSALATMPMMPAAGAGCVGFRAAHPRQASAAAPASRRTDSAERRASRPAG